MVGKGMLYNEPGVLLHNLPLPPNHVKVRVDVAFEGDASLSVPLEAADVMTVEQTISTYVVWPNHLVVTSDIVSPTSKAKDKGKSKLPIASKNVGKQPINGSFTSPVKKAKVS